MSEFGYAGANAEPTGWLVNSRWWLNAGLAALIAALALVLVFKPGHHKAPVVPALTTLSAGQIGHIRLLRPGQPEIDLVKSGGRWIMTAPRRARANRFRIEELLHLATARIVTHFTVPAADLGRYGLAKPDAVVWLDDEKISFGGPHPLDPDHYALYRGQVYVVPDHYDNAAIAPLSGFFSTRLIENRGKLVAIRLPRLSLARKPDGSWKVTPADSKLSTDRINTFVDDWRYAQALSVSPYSGKPVIARARFTFASSPVKAARGHSVAAAPGKRVLVLGIVERKPELIFYRKDGGLEYHLPADMASQLLELKPH